MFTGIVEEVGKVLNITDDTLAFSASKTIEDAIVGSSICVNGVCLTLISLDKNSGTVNIGPETKKLSNIGELTLNNLVNLERPLSPQDRFGGHIVQGHIEGTCTIVNIIKNDISYEIDLKSQEYLNRYIVKKCFITLDGISLTVNEIINNTFRVSIIPHTWENTNLQNRKIGDRINVETDIIARYIERFLEK
ncbi:MAG: riboflavin synthase [SAR202 cluster bacterium]|nr:riboflavin synthase [SAR202 cluster bacterium]|tara:strand:+ start:23277 stop:23852 length:576 start_codon:yes stop_codon:yes gene_type:complete